MFDVLCRSLGRRVLVFSSEIEDLRNTREGVEVHYRCPCGRRGVWYTGKARGGAGLAGCGGAAAPSVCGTGEEGQIA